MESEESVTSSRPDKQELLLLAGLFLVALVVRLYFLPFYRVISADGVGYVNAARSLLHGNLQPLTVYGVVYPTLTALTSLTGLDTESAGRIVSAVMGSLLVVPLYLLGKEFVGRKGATVACLLVLAWPSLRSWAGEVMTQPSYITLLVSWYWLLWQAYRRDSFGWGVAAGAVAGLSYLTRPEALVAFAAMVLVLLLPAGARPLRRRLALTATCVAGFAALLFPFVLLVHHFTGLWQLTGKGAATLADSLSEYLQRPDLKNETGFKGIGFLDVIRSYPDFIWSNSKKNLADTLRNMVPWYLWTLAWLGFVAGGWSRSRVIERGFLLTSFAPLAIIIVFFFTGPEYLQPYLPVLFLWAGQGLCTAEGLLARVPALAPLQRSPSLAPLSMLAVSVLAVKLFLSQVPGDRNKPYSYDDDGGRYDQRRIGELLKKQLPPGSRIMTRWGRITFYSELENPITMPQGSLPEIIDVARKNGVRYLIVDGMLQGARPQLGPLFVPLLNSPERLLVAVNARDNISPVPGVRLCLLYKDPSSVGVAVYEINS